MFCYATILKASLWLVVGLSVWCKALDLSLSKSLVR